MNKQTLKFGDIVVTKKIFMLQKKAIPLTLVNINNVFVSYRVKHNNDCYKYFIGYNHDDMISPLCIVLAQMTGF